MRPVKISPRSSSGGNTDGDIVLSRGRSAVPPPQGGSAQSQNPEDDRSWLRKGWDAVGEWVAEHARTIGPIRPPAASRRDWVQLA